MTMLMRDQDLERRVIARRRRLGQDKFDEVWNGVYVMSPLANDEHQDVIGGLNSLLREVVQQTGLGVVRPGVNVTDRHVGWKKNFRCPDVAVFLNGTKAVNFNTHWLGGPDLAIEVISEGERPKRKLGFYAKIGTRELLVVDRAPWKLTLYSLQDGELVPAESASAETGTWLFSNVVPLSFRLIDGDQRPRIEAQHVNGQLNWIV